MKNKIIIAVIFLQLISSNIFSQTNVNQKLVENLQKAIVSQSSQLNQLEEYIRELSSQNDILLQSESSQKKLIEQLEKRILILESSLRLIEDKLNARIDNTEIRDESIDNIGNNNIDKVENDFDEAKLNYYSNLEIDDAKYLYLFDQNDENLSETALFSTAFTFRNIGEFEKSQGYFAKFRQKYSNSEFFSLSNYLSGLNANDISEFEECIYYLKKYLPNANRSNIDLTRWTLANCSLKLGLTSEARKLLMVIVGDETSSYQAEARKLLNSLE